MFKKLLDLNKLSTLLLYISIIVFVIAFNFSDNPPSGWYQQFLPTNIGNAYLTDITFTDSLTGYAVTNVNPDGNSFIIKTINGGDNWNIIFTDTNQREFTKVVFLNNDTGFAGTKYFTGGARLYRTINGGINWTTLNNINTFFEYDDFTVLNYDTIWVTDNSAFDGGIFRTTNGSLSWENKFFNTFSNPEKIYMFDSNFGFMQYNSESYRTINSGINWNAIPGLGEFSDIYFIDNLTGWMSSRTGIEMKKTSDGGFTWIIQPFTPKNPNIFFSRIYKFSVLNKDTIWGFGRSEYYFQGNGTRGFIHKTTNGGLNWGYQIPDTSIHISQYNFGDFVNNLNGWAYSVGGIHTVTGGNDSTIYVGINQNENTVPLNFILKQNYPNPFNPRTVISYELEVSSFITMKVYDILGNEVKTLVNKKQNAGEYKVEFDASGLSSGIYFYSLFADENRIDTKKLVLVR